MPAATSKKKGKGKKGASSSLSCKAWIAYCDGVGATNVAIHDEKTDLLAIQCVRVGQGLSPGNTHLMPTSRAFLEIVWQTVHKRCADVKEALEAMFNQDEDDMDSRDRTGFADGTEPVRRDMFVRCPPSIAAGVVESAAALSPDSELRKAEDVLRVFRSKGAEGAPNLRALPELVDAWGAGHEGLALKNMIAHLNFKPMLYTILNARGEYTSWGFAETMRRVYGPKCTLRPSPNRGSVSRSCLARTSADISVRCCTQISRWEATRAANSACRQPWPRWALTNDLKPK